MQQALRCIGVIVEEVSVLDVAFFDNRQFDFVDGEHVEEFLRSVEGSVRKDVADTEKERTFPVFHGHPPNFREGPLGAAFGRRRIAVVFAHVAEGAVMFWEICHQRLSEPMLSSRPVFWANTAGVICQKTRRQMQDIAAGAIQRSPLSQNALLRGGCWWAR